MLKRSNRSCEVSPSHLICPFVCVPAAANAVWQVYLEPEDGWRPDWEKGVMAAVVLGCLLMSLLVGIIMASWAEQIRLLGDVMVSGVLPWGHRLFRQMCVCFDCSVASKKLL